MNIAQIIQFEGSTDVLVWKSPIENFNTMSRLIVDSTHEALLVINGNACDLFGAGDYVLETSNIPIAQRLINIPTDGVSSFPCKVFFINIVHQMDITWGIPGEIAINDPVYNIFLHVGMCGSMNFKVAESRKFLLKLAGFRDEFRAEDTVAEFRGIITKYVKSYIAKIMNVGRVSYFDMNENLFEISELIGEELNGVFDDYGIEVTSFNIETITAPDEDLALVKQAKALDISRKIQGFSWQEERQMDIVETFAKNEGTMGNMSGAVGGFMLGGAFGGSVADMARTALNPEQNSSDEPRNETRTTPNPIGSRNPKPFDVAGFMENYGKDGTAEIPEQPTPDSTAVRYCRKCGRQLEADANFCERCGTRVSQGGDVCPRCGRAMSPDALFCARCGWKREW
ncbi:MAG: SPFH domain-containing protein [Lachnospiraceae bacterium]|nr:SPFH domain-containing protein [Lachnospiraceae bacterium]